MKWRRYFAGIANPTRTTVRSAMTDIPSPVPENELAPLPALPLGRYRHYKGGEYEVLGVARHSETHQALVVYRPLYNATGWWVRPFAMFAEAVDVDGVRQPRFAFVA